MEISEIRIKRSQFRGSLTRFETFLASIDNQQLNEETIHHLQKRLETIEPIFKLFDEFQSQIETNLDEEDNQKGGDIREEFKICYYASISKARSIITSFHDNKISNTSITSSNTQSNVDDPNEDQQSIVQNQIRLSSDSNNSNTNSSDRSDLHKVKYPPIRLPSFSGSYEGENSGNQCQASTENPTVTSNVFNNFVDSQVLLSTAVVRIEDHKGQLQLAPIPLDNGSQSSFITEEICQRLNLKRSPTNSAIRGRRKKVEFDMNAYLGKRTDYMEKCKKGLREGVKIPQVEQDMSYEDEYFLTESEDEIGQTKDKFQETEKILKKISKERISKEKNRQ
ncbi:hypothetical protein JTB14_022052 [Gonioctena quinquepunctata]|nr:hypothetical protein JTB14_022052 [Gonioctena quinquepunctata]